MGGVSRAFDVVVKITFLGNKIPTPEAPLSATATEAVHGGGQPSLLRLPRKSFGSIDALIASLSYSSSCILTPPNICVCNFCCL